MILFNKIRILPLTPHITVLFGTWVVGDGRKPTICFLWDLDSNMRGVYFMFVCAYVQIKTYPTIFLTRFLFSKWWISKYGGRFSKPSVIAESCDLNILRFARFEIRPNLCIEFWHLDLAELSLESNLEFYYAQRISDGIFNSPRLESRLEWKPRQES